MSLRRGDRWSRTAVLAGLVLGAGGCHKVTCLMGRGAELEEAATCYQEAMSAGDYASAYRYASAATRREVSEDEWIKDRTEAKCRQVGWTVAKQEVVAGTRRAAVVARSDCGCEREDTRTWVEEDGRWRFVYLLKTRQAAVQAGDKRDQAKVRSLVGSWLAVEPYSVAARHILAWGGEDLAPLGEALDVNPRDHFTLLMAKELGRRRRIDGFLGARSPPLAVKDLLASVSPATCGSEELATGLAGFLGAEDRAAFLERFHGNPYLWGFRLVGLAEAGQKAAVAELLRTERATVQEKLKGESAQRAATVLGSIGQAHYVLGEWAAAREAAKEALSRKADDAYAKGLLKRIEEAEHPRPGTAESGGQRYWTISFDCGAGPEAGDMVRAASPRAAIDAYCRRECSSKWQGAAQARCAMECGLALAAGGRGGDYFGSRSCRYRIR